MPSSAKWPTPTMRTLKRRRPNVSALSGRLPENCGRYGTDMMLNADYKEMLQILLDNKENLIKNKLSTGRDRDRLDAEYLQTDDST